MDRPKLIDHNAEGLLTGCVRSYSEVFLIGASIAINAFSQEGNEAVKLSKAGAAGAQFGTRCVTGSNVSRRARRDAVRVLIGPHSHKLEQKFVRVPTSLLEQCSCTRRVRLFDVSAVFISFVGTKNV